MKRVLITIILSIFIYGVYAQKFADVKFEQTVCNVGEFTENRSQITSLFTFTNIGTAPLFFFRSVAPCGCMSIELPKEPILPGKRGIIKITYSIQEKYPGYFKKTIAVFANTNQQRYVLSIEGIIQSQRDE